MAKTAENYKKWRMNRRGAGVRRRRYILTRTPAKRLSFFQHEGYCLNSMGLCYQRRLKLRLSSRKICVARYIIVVEKEEE